MKKLIVIFCLLILASASCKKSNRTYSPNQWRLVEVFFSPGGLGSWHPADPAISVIISFASDGKFVTTRNGVVDSSASGVYTTMDNKIFDIQLPNLKARAEIKDASLFLYPVAPLCIEGCNSRYERILID